MPESFNWLHLTDLHYGQSGQRPLWPNVRKAFFDDLKNLHERCGPWHAVLFTGDLVQSGQHKEFEQMEAQVLGRLWKELEALGSGNAILLAVPGNHDLDRPKTTAAVRQLLRNGGLGEVQEEFWGDPTSEYREVIDRAFANYSAWWKRTPHRGKAKITEGLLPGDVATTLEIGPHRIGIVGLNTTFLQLAAGEFRGRLGWDLRQLHQVCGGDAVDWIAKHNACLLLTHQGPDWLASDAQKLYPEINPAGRFATHLFGHMHETIIRLTSYGGGKPLRQWQGSSLFGLEKFGDPPTLERRHGYAVGRMEFGGSEDTIRLWPRRAVQDANGWRLIPDHESGELNEDEGTSPEPLTGEKRDRKARRRAVTGREVRAKPQPDERVLVAVYTKAARSLWDIIDLAGLPEDDRHLAMQRFLLRQLYLPLRMTLESVVTEEELITLEKKREAQRLAAAGRVAVEARQKTTRIGLGAWLGTALASRRGDGSGRARNGLEPTPRLVLLGDPGGGKTTLLRWFATACLLRREGDPDFAALPDVESLPAIDWLPVLVRCRDLDKSRVSQATLQDLLHEALAKMQVDASQISSLTAVLRCELEAGRAVLLVDGLDEITDPGPRAAFCERLEVIARLFPHAPILATSRIVGYREMRRRLGEGFAHATLAELTPKEKDAFIGRWCEVTIADPVRRASEAHQLRRGIHGSDRVERLTTNPLLLTTMALVQRKVGKLPTRRHKLYLEAVGVLLNWRREVEDPMDPDEALPQLEYLAYAMCDRGVQQLRRDEVLSLLDDVRCDYPNIRPLHARTPEAFLTHLERRTGLLVEMGEITHDGRLVPVYEFRHLTFQEYLAALALLEGRFPGHQPGMMLAERVRPLAGRIAEIPSPFGALPEKFAMIYGPFEPPERLVTENWREALRLCVASCNDDDVDPALQAILEPTSADEARPRAILALLCLADEPNVSQSTATAILKAFAEQASDDDEFGQSGAVRAVQEITDSVWVQALRETLVAEFISREPEERGGVDGLLGHIVFGTIPAKRRERRAWLEEQVNALTASAEAEAIGAALNIRGAAGLVDFHAVPGLLEGLFTLSSRGAPAADAASRALLWVAETADARLWAPASPERNLLLSHLQDLQGAPSVLRILVDIAGSFQIREAAPAVTGLLRHSSAGIRARAAAALGLIGGPDNVLTLQELLTDKEASVRRAAVEALGELGKETAVASLRKVLHDESPKVREAVEEVLAQIGGRDALRDENAGVRRAALEAEARQRSVLDRRLLSRDVDEYPPWLDPGEPISLDRVSQAARKLSLSEKRVRRRYEALAEEYGLQLAWRTG